MSTEKIIINIADGNRVRAFDRNGLLQVAAYDDAVKALDRCLDQALDFWTLYDKGHKDLFQTHSAIFVEGKRGAGKTSFMSNLSKYWGNEEKHKNKGLHFFKPIDPTLLNNEDNFLNVVISQIYKVVSSSENAGQSNKFWKEFDNVADALEAGSHIGSGEVTGSDKILATRDYIKLGEHLTQFFVSACRILGVKALVIAIDDIDMDLQWGFKVLEVVRRYLASPLVIPVISGELDQYEMMVMAHFAKELNVAGHMADLSHRDLSSPMDDASDKALLSKAKHLSGEYLKKILPPHQRVRILPVPEILRRPGPICVKSGEIEIPLNHIDLKDGKQKQTLLERLSIGMSYRANGVEGSRPAIKLETTRELINLLLVLHRHNLLTSDLATTDWKEPERRLKLAYTMREYWRSQDDLVAVERAKADIQLLSDAGSLTRLSEMAFFNPMKHDQKIANYDLKAQVQDILKKMDQKVPSVPLDRLPRTYMPMPSFEPIHQGFFIGKERIKNLADNEAAKFYINIYANHGYYTSNQQKHLLFFGRAFELVVSNLLGWTDVSTLRRIVSEPPYWSHFYFQSTKTVDGYIDDADADDTGIDGNSVFDASSEFGRGMVEKIKVWHKTHEGVLSAGVSIHTVYKITNKFFNQVNLYKSSISSSEVGGTLDEVNKRLKLILLNAVSSFESQQDVVVRQNFGLRNLDAYKQSNVWTQNIDPLLKQESLTRAIFDHPLFAVEGLEDVLIGGSLKKRGGAFDLLADIDYDSDEFRTTVLDSIIIDDDMREYLLLVEKSLSPGEKSSNSRAFNKILGESLWQEILNADEETAAELADRVIATVWRNLLEIKPIANAMAAQIEHSKGNPYYIRRVMDWAGRRDDLIKLLLAIK